MQQVLAFSNDQAYVTKRPDVVSTATSLLRNVSLFLTEYLNTKLSYNSYILWNTCFHRQAFHMVEFPFMKVMGTFRWTRICVLYTDAESEQWVESFKTFTL
jgi:hypothetical protein